MTFHFIPEENDFLNYLYYVTNKSKRVTRKRTLNKLVVLFVYFITGLFLYNKQGPVTSGIFFLLCLPMYFLYSYFEKRQYLKHFIRYISANYKDEIGRKTTISLDDKGVTVSLGESNHKLLWTDIEIISETNPFILIQEKGQNSIVVPKQKTQHLEELIAELKRIASIHNIPYGLELDWKWK